MDRIGKIALAGTALFAACGRAYGAEPPLLPPLPPPPIVQKAPAFVEEYVSGWYLRGDIGYRMNDTSGASVAYGFAPTSPEIDDNYSFGGGAGYKSGWFRADATVDWATKTNYKAGSSANARDYTMKIESATFLANIYLDLGTWGGFTPYVGAGAGMSWQRIHDFTSVSAAATLLESANKWNFAWAYMGGFTFNLAPNLLFDASYRRLELGDAVGPLFNGGERFTAKDNGAHEFRIGLRYNLD